MQRCARTIASPGLQPKAAANSGMFDGAPIARKRPSGCGLVFVCSLSNSGRPLVAQTRAQFKKSRCSAVSPSIGAGRGLPSRLFWNALYAIVSPPRSAIDSPRTSLPFWCRSPSTT